MPVTRQVIVEKAAFVAAADEIERATREKKSIRWREPFRLLSPIDGSTKVKGPSGPDGYGTGWPMSRE